MSALVGNQTWLRSVVFYF